MKKIISCFSFSWEGLGVAFLIAGGLTMYNAELGWKLAIPIFCFQMAGILIRPIFYKETPKTFIVLLVGITISLTGYSLLMFSVVMKSLIGISLSILLFIFSGFELRPFFVIRRENEKIT